MKSFTESKIVPSWEMDGLDLKMTKFPELSNVPLIIDNEGDQVITGFPEGINERLGEVSNSKLGTIGGNAVLGKSIKDIQRNDSRSSKWNTRVNIIDSPYLRVSKSMEGFQELGIPSAKWSFIAHTAFALTIIGQFGCLISY
ncbi:MAG: hypothetical protein K2Q22_13715 [Cytophagales bacterium]|nr:hypothetical protein [Cytophagales bacterium]